MSMDYFKVKCRQREQNNKTLGKASMHPIGRNTMRDSITRPRLSYGPEEKEKISNTALTVLVRMSFKSLSSLWLSLLLNLTCLVDPSTSGYRFGNFFFSSMNLAFFLRVQ